MDGSKLNLDLDAVNPDAANLDAIDLDAIDVVDDEEAIDASNNTPYTSISITSSGLSAIMPEEIDFLFSQSFSLSLFPKVTLLTRVMSFLSQLVNFVKIDYIMRFD